MQNGRMPGCAGTLILAALACTACTYKEAEVYDASSAASLGRDVEIVELLLADSSRVEFAGPYGRVVGDSVIGPLTADSTVTESARISLANVLEVRTQTEKAGTAGTVTAGLTIALVAGAALLALALSQAF